MARDDTLAMAAFLGLAALPGAARLRGVALRGVVVVPVPEPELAMPVVSRLRRSFWTCWLEGVLVWPLEVDEERGGR